ncbi:hypothetical protein HUA74_44525 [Myxococcus sp. CA051A]|uniref:hypothetical protein n=1 Tax=Myxococcus sp. CA051A TaxID=2741739 RepID=UPI00157AE1DF|nr:hypothetical protein [Myxococcus sp. CA051A]NTX67731.1 hypothetical protein [Myxococcus sp. CA051A]
MGKLFSGALFAAGLMFAGCGGTQADVKEENLASSEGELLVCDGAEYYRRDYYTNATYSTLAGARGCDCDANSLNWGTVTAYVISWDSPC